MKHLKIFAGTTPDEVEEKANKWFSLNSDIKIVKMGSNITGNMQVITIIYADMADQVKNFRRIKDLATVFPISRNNEMIASK